MVASLSFSSGQLIRKLAKPYQLTVSSVHACC
jgi:hypothetical protein